MNLANYGNLEMFNKEITVWKILCDISLLSYYGKYFPSMVKHLVMEKLGNMTKIVGNLCMVIYKGQRS